MVLATFNCFQIPFDIAFEPEEFDHPLFQIINFLIDFSFVLDIIVSFRTTYFDEATGNENKNTTNMAIRYLQGHFTLDLLATVPFDMIAKIFVSDGG